MFQYGESKTLSELGLVSRRTALQLGAAAVGGLATNLIGVPQAKAGLTKLEKANATKVRQFTGPKLTGRFAAPYVDLCIPVRLADGSLLFIGGDTYSEPAPETPANDWRAPTILRSGTRNLNAGVVINGAITDRPGHAKDLVGETHGGNPLHPTTALPSDIFRVGNTLYMHLMRGPIYDTHHTDFWKSIDNGNTWKYIRQWPRDMYGYQFQQKSYAAETDASDPYVYVLSTTFDRTKTSGLLLFRVFKNDLGKPEDSRVGPVFAYQGWGYANGRWDWGNQPTTITEPRLWGEICFRAMGGKYAFSWFQANTNHALEDIRAQVFAFPTSNLFVTTEQTMVYSSTANPASDGNPAHVQPFLYGGFIFPGSTFDNFHIAVSNWDRNAHYSRAGNYSNYVVSQWRTKLSHNS